MPTPKEKTKIVSIRVPESLPSKVKAATGLSFSAAITQFFEALVLSLNANNTPTDGDPQ